MSKRYCVLGGAFLMVVACGSSSGSGSPSGGDAAVPGSDGGIGGDSATGDGSNSRMPSTIQPRRGGCKLHIDTFPSSRTGFSRAFNFFRSGRA